MLDTATRLENRTLLPKSRNMIPYFGHDSSLVPFIAAMGFETITPVVSFGAAMIMELHRNKTTSEIGYKVCCCLYNRA